jgi:hypothetical protein
MKKEDLIKQLEQLPAGIEVCIMDWRKNLHHANDEPNTESIEPDFNLARAEEGSPRPFIALEFKNDDYLDSGLKSDPDGTLDERLECPECENPYPHGHRDGFKSCDECGNKWKP